MEMEVMSLVCQEESSLTLCAWGYVTRGRTHVNCTHCFLSAGFLCHRSSI